MPISEMESYFKNTLFYVLKGIEVLHVRFKTKPLRKKHQKISYPSAVIFL